MYFAFGINPDPGTKVPYLQVDEYDYWVGDSSSPLYNQYARADSDTDWDKSKSERIIDYPTAYGYCLFIGYNIEGVPGKGCFSYIALMEDQRQAVYQYQSLIWHLY